MQRVKFVPEDRSEVIPIYEVMYIGIGRQCLPLVNPVYPFLGSTLGHICHGPLDLYLFFRELVGSQPEEGLTGVYKSLTVLPVPIVLRRERRLKFPAEVICRKRSGSGLFY